eukprot:CAMPEP_0172557404 /NCGR_PEP_ID=MMETSP1067-20121228/73030_1 /TAXON_ID=265564 ORGANISM="Thalassiosira punctigera, Strain Tpunct2005C2" /NCGR_SAMPLE_ID=MMETSP1067 /ASSEMBLY_ACC=CAM_ASM_000444 /LENGTH=120 /DNA_ID=CAMNT_0013346481 /DNA_START=99 /DNA_END=461 /DNA_ORIENTATION=-
MATYYFSDILGVFDVPEGCSLSCVGCSAADPGDAASVAKNKTAEPEATASKPTSGDAAGETSTGSEGENSNSSVLQDHRDEYEDEDPSEMSSSATMGASFAAAILIASALAGMQLSSYSI